METKSPPEIVPALGFAWLTPLYDAVMAVTMREKLFRSALIGQAAIGPRHEVLDLACGTGTLAVMICAQDRAAKVTGLDADPQVLEIARRKAREAGVAVKFDEGFSNRLPYPDGSFDRVVSSLLFHHLSSPNKVATAVEVFRVLRPGGEVHVADWGRPANAVMGSLFLMVRLLDGFPNTRENVQGKLADIFRAAGFVDVKQTGAMSTLFGTLAFYRALRPDDPGGRSTREAGRSR